MYIINPWWLYLASIAGAIQVVMLVFFSIFLCFAAYYIVQILDFQEEKCVKEHSKKVLKVVVLPPLIIQLFGFILIPSQGTCYKMMAASVVTTDNIDKSADFIIDKIVKTSQMLQNVKVDK